MKKFISILLSLVTVFTLAVPSFAADTCSFSIQTISDTSSERIVVVDNVKATYNKVDHTITIEENGRCTTFGLDLNNYCDDDIALPYASGNVTIRDETVWMHEYEYYKTSSNVYYWCIDIPSLNINPNEWCDPITVRDNGSKAAKACEKFASYIDDAKENEVDLLAYGGAIAISAAVGFIAKNLEFTKAAYIAACAAAGITVTGNVAGIAGDYINNILNSRDEYYAVKGYLA